MSGRSGAARPKRAPKHRLDADLERAGAEILSYEQEERDDLSKKVRFDHHNPVVLAQDLKDEDADPVLDLDEIDKAGKRKRNRNKIEIDGYSSDSSDGGFAAAAAKKKKAAKDAAKAASKEAGAASDEDEDMDLFADEKEAAPKSDDDDDDGKKKKKLHIMDDDEIKEFLEGDIDDMDKQTVNQLPNENEESDSTSDSESDAEGRDAIPMGLDPEVGAGGKKKHAPKIDKFGLKGEAEEGGFDGSGNFVRRADDPDAVHDEWLSGISRKEMRAAAKAKEQTEAKQREKERAQEEVLTSTHLEVLINHLKKRETVMEALTKLNPPKTKKKQTYRKMGEDPMDVDAKKSEDDATEKKRVEAVEAISGAVTQLQVRGEENIYNFSRERLISRWEIETGDDWEDPEDKEEKTWRDVNAIDWASDAEYKMWQFRYVEGAEAGKVHGPYDGKTIAYWMTYNWVGGPPVEVVRAPVED